MPDILSLFNNNVGATPVANAAGAAPFKDPFTKVLESYDTNPAAEIMNADTGVNNEPLKIKDADKYLKYGVYLNDVDTQEQLDRRRAENQSALEQFGRMAIQTVGDRMVLGTLRGFSDLADLAVSTFTGDRDFTNPISGTIEGWQDAIRERYEIYRKDPSKGIDLTDLGWYLNGIPDIASTLSLLIPAAGTAKLASYIGKAARSISAINKAAKAGRTWSKALAGRAGINGVMQAKIGAAANNLGMAGLMRAAENYQEARESYKNIYDDAINNLSLMRDEERAALYRRHPEYSNMSDEEVATKLAEEGATDVFKDDFWMLVFDAWQLRGISNMYKNILNREATSAVRAAERTVEAGLIGQTVQKAGINKYIPSLAAAKGYAAELSEGFEEAFQYVQQQEAEDNARATLDPTTRIRTMSDYMMDDQMWNAAIWGAIGGIVFKGLGEAGSKYYNKLTKRPDVSSAMRIADIQQRAGQAQALMKDIQDLNDGYVARVDASGQYVKDSEGNVIYDKIDPIDAEAKKEELLNRHIADVVVKAANVGNYDLAKQFFNSDSFKQYVGTFNNMADEQTSNEFIEDISRRMDDVFDTYYNETLNATNAGIEDYRIAQNVAYSNTANALGIRNANKRQTEYEKVIAEIQQDILDKSSDSQKETLQKLFDKANTNFIYNTIDANIKNVENLKAQAKKQLDDGKIGQMQYNKTIEYYDNFLNNIINETNLKTEEGNKVTRDNIQEEINKNKLSDAALFAIKGYSEDLYNAYDKSNAAKVDAAYFGSKTMKTADEYKNAAKQWENMGKEAARKAYDEAVNQLENLYNSNDVNEVTTYIATKEPGTLSEETRRNIDDAYNAMVDFSSPMNNIEATIDKIARTAHKQKQPSNATGVINNINPEEVSGGTPVGNGGTSSATASATTTGAVQNPNPAPTPEPNPNPQPQPEPQQNAPEPTADDVKDEEYRINIGSKILRAFKDFRDEVKDVVLSKEEFAERVKDRIVANDKISKDYLESPAIKNSFDSNIDLYYDAYLNQKAGELSSVATFDKMIINFDETTEKDVEQLINQYIEEAKITGIGSKTYINPNSLIKYILNKYKEKNRRFSYDDVLAIYDKVFDYLKNNKGNYKILNASDKRNRLRTHQDVDRLLKQTKRDEIEGDNRINLLSHYNITDPEQIAKIGVTAADFSYAMSMLRVGTELYVNRGAKGTGGVYSVQFFYNKPGKNGIKIANNAFRPLPHGDGYYFSINLEGSTKPIYMTLRKDANGNFVSDYDEIFDAILLNDTSKYSIKEIEQARDFIFSFGVEGNIDDLKNNSIFVNFINKMDNRNKEDLSEDEIRSAADRISNIIYYKDYSMPEEQNFAEVYKSYKNFLKRMYNNFEYTKAIYDAIGKEKNKLVKVPIKSINRGKASYDREGEPKFLGEVVTPEFDFRKGGKAEIIFQVGGEMVSEGGYRQTTSNSEDANLLHVFNFYLPTGGKNNPEFVTLQQANVDVTSPYGGAIKEEIMSLFTKYVNKKIKFNTLKNRLNAIFNDDGLVHGIDAQSGNVNGREVYRIKLFDNNKAPLIFYRFKNNTNEEAYSITVPGPNGTYNNITNADKLKNVEKIIDNILSNGVYAFPGNVILGNSAYNKNGYIKRVVDKNTGVFKGYNINVGSYKKTFATFGNFIVDANIAKTDLRKITFKKGGRIVESNFDYADYRPSYESARITASDIYYADREESEEMERASDASKAYSGNVLNAVEQKGEITIKTSELLNGMAPQYMRRINSLPMELLSVNDLFPEEIRITNDNRNDYGFYKQGKQGKPGIIYLTKKYFADFGTPARDGGRGAYNAMRVVLHENIHKQIYESNSVTFDNLNKTLNEVREAINKALNDPNSEEYKDLDRAFANAASVRDLMKVGIQQIENSYSDLSGDKRIRAINEEYLVESMTNDLFQKVANNIYLRGETASIDRNKSAEKKSLLQKIFDFIRKLFNFGEIKDNTLLAKEFNALAQTVTEVKNEEEKIDNNNNTSNTNTGNKVNAYGQRRRGGRVSRSVATFSMPSINSIEKSNSAAENAKFRRLIERGEVHLRCV